jgi:hypothetical protein
MRYVYYGATERERLLAIVVTERDDKIRVTTGSVAREKSETMKNQNVGIPKFTNEGEEAKWWASAEGRDFLKRQSAQRTPKNQKGSPLVRKLSQVSSVQIALRLPGPDLARARGRSPTARELGIKRF